VATLLVVTGVIMISWKNVKGKLLRSFRIRMAIVSALASGILLFFSTPIGSSEIFVAAASSLTDVLQAVSKAYDAPERPRVAFSFGASSNLARQLVEGAPVDIFISADEKKMNQLERKGLVDRRNRRNLLSNRLVIVKLEESSVQVKSPFDLLRSEVRRIALAEPSSVPAGLYAKAYFKEKGLWQQIQSKVIPVSSVRAVVATVESGNVDVGVVYKTDVAVSRLLTVAYEVPPEEGPKVVYPAAILERSKDRRTAEDFFKFLFSGTAQAIFKRYGFILLE